MTPIVGGGEEQEMLRKLIQAAAIFAICSGPAAAQVNQTPSQSNLSIPLNQKLPPTKEEIERQNARDRDYEAAMKKIPDKKSSGDPWGDIRPGKSPAAANKQQ
jgi:hypothetical protein